MQKIAGTKRPVCYAEFLKYLGKDMDRKEPVMRGYLAGNTVFDEALFDNKEGAEELLAEEGSPLKLTDDDFVFYDSLGILFAFSKLSEGDNPPVYFYHEGSKRSTFIKIADTLSSFYGRNLAVEHQLFQLGSTDN